MPPTLDQLLVLRSAVETVRAESSRFASSAPGELAGHAWSSMSAREYAARVLAICTALHRLSDEAGALIGRIDERLAVPADD